MRRTKEDALQTREAILDAAETLFLENGVASTTLSQIAAAAGLTRGAIYWHFENKLELFKAMQERARLPQEQFFAPRADGSTPSLQELYESTLEAMRYLSESERSRRVFTILFFRCEYVGEMQAAMMRRSKVENGMQQAIADIFEAVHWRGELKPEIGPQDAAIAYMAAVGGIFSQWLQSDGQFDLVAVGAQLVRAVIAGFACPDAVGLCLADERTGLRFPVRVANG